MKNQDEKQIIEMAAQLYADGSISKDEFLRKINQCFGTTKQAIHPEQESVEAIVAAMNSWNKTRSV